MKKDSSVAVTRLMPRIRPAEIVAPERDTPGMSEKHCTSPMTSPSLDRDVVLAALDAALLEHVVPLLGDPDDGAPQDQRGRDDPQAAQGAGDEVAGEEADDADRERADDDRPREGVVLVLARLGGAQAARPRP